MKTKILHLWKCLGMLWLTALFLFANNMAVAQDFIGFNSHPYAGVSGMDVNPANILGTVYKADITLGGASLFAHNNYLQFNPKAPWSWSLDKDKSFELNANGLNTNIYAHSRAQLPSFMIDLNFNAAVALTIQHRTALQVENLGAEFAKLAYEDFEFPKYHNNVYDSNGFDARLLSWTEVGLGGGYLFYFEGEHRIKVAARIKWLGGISAMYMQTSDFDYQFDNDSIMNVYESTFAYGHSENTNPFKPEFQSNSVGFDFGVKYTFLKNKYVIGASILDVGKLTFDKARGSGDFTADVEDWNINPLKFQNVGDFDDTLSVRANFVTDEREFDVFLPTALSFQVTAYLWESGFFEGGGHQNFYLNLTTYHRLKLGPSDAKRINAINTYSATLGFNSISIGAGVPITIMNNLESTHVGGFFRMGPFVVGSKNFFTNVFAKEINETDVYAALKIPILKPKPRIIDGCPKHW